MDITIIIMLIIYSLKETAAGPLRSAETSNAKSNIHSDFESDKPTIRKIMTVNSDAMINKNVIFGDEFLTPDQMSKYNFHQLIHGRKKRAVLKKDTTSQWPNGRVPYEINNNYSIGGTLNNSAITTIKSAMRKIEDVSCVRFVPKKDTDKDYIRIISEAGCWSYVGRQGEVQDLSIDVDGCVWEDIIIHELLHALGFYHEQSRPDREDYIKFLWDNIDKNESQNFDKRNETDSLGVEYDVKSIMHYDSYAFSKNGKKTMIMKGEGNQDIELGGSKLTSSDIRQLNLLYECTTIPTILNANTRDEVARRTSFTTTTALKTTDTTTEVIVECKDKVDFCDLVEKSDCTLDFYQLYCTKTCTACADNKIQTTTTTRMIDEATTTSLVTKSSIITTGNEICEDDDHDICNYIDPEHCSLDFLQLKCPKTCDLC